MDAPFMPYGGGAWDKHDELEDIDEVMNAPDQLDLAQGVWTPNDIRDATLYLEEAVAPIHLLLSQPYIANVDPDTLAEYQMVVQELWEQFRVIRAMVTSDVFRPWATFLRQLHERLKAMRRNLAAYWQQAHRPRMKPVQERAQPQTRWELAPSSRWGQALLRAHERVQRPRVKPVWEPASQLTQ
ncbi:hypothetical protein IAT38_003281 [Cryptococcus sp. DSM 104549]